MSNRPNPSRRPTAPPSATTPDRRRVLLLAGIAVAVVVVIGVLLALGGADDDKSSSGSDAPDFGPVAVEGTSLADLPDGGADPAVGTAAPVLEVTDPQGSGTTVGAAGDEPTLIAFVAHWCPHCQAEVPVLVDLMEAGDLDGVRTVAVLTGTKDSAPNYPPVAWLERERWSGDIVLDDERSTAARAYGLTAYPYLVWLDADGTVVARTSGEVPREALLQQIDAVRSTG
ncbi:MAG TPA: TlpA disulfide reductase family protein [Acidimicrobiales bacterium]|nr:TlpA disulfide reductase family protein [Acidimicrobiales bacterium]